jgi:predicted site-specific integrase-resolvase
MTPPLLTPADAAAWLQVSRKTLLRYHAQGLRCVQLTAKTIRYRLDDLQAFIRSKELTEKLSDTKALNAKCPL